MRHLRVALLAAAIAVAAVPVSAHHPFASTFDWKQPITVSGTVTSVDWSAPHVTMELQIFEYVGEPDVYVLELGSPAALERFGWKKSTIIAGDEVRIDGWRAYREMFVSVRTLTTTDGRQFFGASSFYDGFGACVSGEYCGDDEEGDVLGTRAPVSRTPVYQGDVVGDPEYCLPS